MVGWWLVGGQWVVGRWSAGGREVVGQVVGGWSGCGRSGTVVFFLKFLQLLDFYTVFKTDQTGPYSIWISSFLRVDFKYEISFK